MPTALELSREEWRPYFDSIRQRRLPAISAVEEQQRSQLINRVREVTAELKHRFGVKRVILYWEAWRLAEEIINSRPVDLIDVETAKNSLLRAIHKYGLEL